MTGFSYTDDDGAVVELTPRDDGSLTVTAQGAKGPIVCIAIPVGERPRLAAAARPRVSTDLDDDWRLVDATYLRGLIAERGPAALAGGPDDG